MSKLIYKSAEKLKIGGPRGLFEVWETKKGIKVVFKSLYPEEEKTFYFKEYPKFPENWNEKMNEMGDTAASWWLEDLFNNYNPWKVIHS